MDPKQLSEELRQGQNPHMTRRRWIIGLSMLGGSMSKPSPSTRLGSLITYPHRRDKSFSMQTALTLLITLTTNSTHPTDP
jgi:hypothetical protein